MTRRSAIALDVGRSLFLIALWSAVGVIGPAAALRAGDAFSVWVLNEAAHGQAADRLIELASLEGIESAGAAILLGLIMMLAGLVQAVLMMFREGSLVILSGVVVLAAAGTTMGATRPWLPKVTGWMLALICYKPAAALVYASAITLVGEGEDARTVIIGLAMMVLAIVALPALMKLFTWTTNSAAGGSGGASLAATAATGASLLAARNSRSGGPAADHARQLEQDLARRDGPAGAQTAPPAATAQLASTAGPSAAPATAGTGAATAGTGAASAGTGAAAAATGPVGVAVAAVAIAAKTASASARSAGDAMTPGSPA